MGRDAAVEGADAFGGFGGVLGDVAGDGLVGEVRRSMVIGRTSTWAPQRSVATAVRRPRGWSTVTAAAACAYGVGRGGRRRPSRAGASVGPVRAVEADDGVEVDDAAPLVFGDLGEGDREDCRAVPLAVSPADLGDACGAGRG